MPTTLLTSSRRVGAQGRLSYAVEWHGPAEREPSPPSGMVWPVDLPHATGGLPEYGEEAEQGWPAAVRSTSLRIGFVDPSGAALAAFAPVDTMAFEEHDIQIHVTGTVDAISYDFRLKLRPFQRERFVLDRSKPAVQQVTFYDGLARLDEHTMPQVLPGTSVARALRDSLDAALPGLTIYADPSLWPYAAGFTRDLGQVRFAAHGEDEPGELPTAEDALTALADAFAWTVELDWETGAWRCLPRAYGGQDVEAALSVAPDYTTASAPLTGRTLARTRGGLASEARLIERRSTGAVEVRGAGRDGGYSAVVDGLFALYYEQSGRYVPAVWTWSGAGISVVPGGGGTVGWRKGAINALRIDCGAGAGYVIQNLGNATGDDRVRLRVSFYLGGVQDAGGATFTGAANPDLLVYLSVGEEGSRSFLAGGTWTAPGAYTRIDRAAATVVPLDNFAQPIELTATGAPPLAGPLRLELRSDSTEGIFDVIDVAAERVDAATGEASPDHVFYAGDGYGELVKIDAPRPLECYAETNEQGDMGWIIPAAWRSDIIRTAMNTRGLFGTLAEHAAAMRLALGAPGLPVVRGATARQCIGPATALSLTLPGESAAGVYAASGQSWTEDGNTRGTWHALPAALRHSGLPDDDATGALGGIGGGTADGGGTNDGTLIRQT